MKTTPTYTLVTGATSGIGYELALLFAKKGHNLILVSHDLNKMQAKSVELRDYGIDVKTFQADLFEPKHAFSVCEKIDELDLIVDVLVSNLSQVSYGQFKDTDIRDELDIIQLNIASMLILTKYFFRKMVSRKSGKIVHVIFPTSEAISPLHTVYEGTNAFVLSFNHSLMKEAKEHGVIVTTLIDGITEPDFIDKVGLNEANKLEDEITIADSKAMVNDNYNVHAVTNGLRTRPT